jgi:hypothetical protein
MSVLLECSGVVRVGRFSILLARSLPEGQSKLLALNELSGTLLPRTMLPRDQCLRLEAEMVLHETPNEIYGKDGSGRRFLTVLCASFGFL